MDSSNQIMKRPKRNETEEDILRMQQQFLAEKEKNPNLKPAAQMVKFEKAPRKSLFSQNRQQKRKHAVDETIEKPASVEIKEDSSTTLILGEIHEKIVGDITSKRKQISHNIVVGDIIEHSFAAPKETEFKDALPFPAVEKQKLQQMQTNGKSIFANLVRSKQQPVPMDIETNVENPMDLTAVFGTKSVIVDDEQTANEVHKENLELLSKMNRAQIMAEREEILKSIDPSLVALLAKKRKENLINDTKPESSTTLHDLNVDSSGEQLLLNDNPAADILQQSCAENWLHFDVVEKDKLAWMRDIPTQAAKLKSGEKFEARFDWKGVLLPYSIEEITKTDEIKDERELYLHGSEPHRPGYTLQELFRLARSNVLQQRVSAFGAIAGILNIYNQGFYDLVLELPISKIFFLLRFGFDDNTPAMLEITSRALALLCYNETDETLLDFIYDNPNCHWQPILQVLPHNGSDDDPTSLENLQKQMEQLQMSANARCGADIKANVQENEEESKTSMSDFQLAETDLMDCFLRTNILQRIYFVLESVRAENTTVSSCLKLLIRLARFSKDVALQIVNNEDLIKCLLQNFLPGLESIDTMQRTTKFYGYPQHLCLKLIRVLISQNLGIALKFVTLGLIEKLQSYLFSAEDIRGKLINVQIESLRILRCFLLLRVENFLYRRFLPAFRFMLEWHFNHSVYEIGATKQIRQHAAAVLAAISCYTAGSGSTLEISTILGDLLHNCCCNWFYQAKRYGIREFSQATLLSTALHAITWYIHHCNGAIPLDLTRFFNFNEKYLREFLASENFIQFISSIGTSNSIVLRDSHDRRNVHPPLPNVGAVVMHRYGPQLIMPQTYALYLLNAIWRMIDLLQKMEDLHAAKALLLDVIIKPSVIEPIVEYLRSVGSGMNRYMATNFFAKPELQFIFKLLCFEGISAYFTKAELLKIAYNFICCLSADQIPEIEKIFERYIFNCEYLDVNAENLKKWQEICLESVVYPHFIVVPPNELTLSVQHTKAPILPLDWPYFQLKTILQNYIDNVKQNPTIQFSEREILQMTFNFVTKLENCNPNLQIVTPTEKLMYLMIAFMGPDSEFLDANMHFLIEQQLLQFYAQSSEHMFQFEASYEGKCQFENLYALFVDHFQAASYGDELFSSLVMVPLAQKYDNKWRRRVWSDYAAALRFLDCNERLLIGGIQAYLEPIEQDESLLRAYDLALRTNLLRPNTLPYRIAKHHVEKFKEKLLNK